MSRPGTARHGTVRQGKAGHCTARHGKGIARQCTAGHCRARHCKARHGKTSLIPQKVAQRALRRLGGVITEPDFLLDRYFDEFRAHGNDPGGSLAMASIGSRANGLKANVKGFTAGFTVGGSP